MGQVCLNKIIQNLERNHLNIKLVPKNIDPSSIIKFTDVALTSHGSVGVEYASFGKNCIVSEKSYYTDCKFNIRPSNISEYRKILNNLNNLNKISKSKITNAKLYLFIFLKLARIKNSFIPDHLPIYEARMRPADEELFWKKTIMNCKKFNFFNNDFEKMFKNQIEYNARHTVNNNYYSVYKKKINDF